MAGVLLTGFAPFGDFAENPSQQVVERLGGGAVRGLVLPVVFGQDVERVFPAIEEVQPELVLSLGLGAGAACLEVERVALNLRRGEQGERPIVAGAPAGYFASLDVERVASAVSACGVPARPHVYAGNYLCNHLMFQVLHRAAERRLPLRAGFIHLPLSTEQVLAGGLEGRPCLPLDAMVEGVRAAIAAASKIPLPHT